MQPFKEVSETPDFHLVLSLWPGSVKGQEEETDLDFHVNPHRCPL